LRPLIEPQLPALIEKLVPGSKRGMRQSERAAKLAKIDAEVAKLTAQRDEILAELSAARISIAVPDAAVATSPLGERLQPLAADHSYSPGRRAQKPVFEMGGGRSDVDRGPDAGI
jgi:hypothetical protein